MFNAQSCSDTKPFETCDLCSETVPAWFGLVIKRTGLGLRKSHRLATLSFTQLKKQIVFQYLPPIESGLCFTGFIYSLFVRVVCHSTLFCPYWIGFPPKKQRTQ